MYYCCITTIYSYQLIASIPFDVLYGAIGFRDQAVAEVFDLLVDSKVRDDQDLADGVSILLAKTVTWGREVMVFCDALIVHQLMVWLIIYWWFSDGLIDGWLMFDG